jgi:SAM-dependent methyltransferase
MKSGSKMSGWIQKWHATRVLPSRFNRLLDKIQAEIPSATASILDVGAGSGTIARGLKDRHASWRMEGVDVLVRPEPLIPVHPFDGVRLPFPDRSFDVVLLIDVLHHASDFQTLLAECVRVAADRVLIKDHCQSGWRDRMTLTAMDWVGNASYGVALSGRYLSDAQWTELYAALPVDVLSRQRVEMYSFPLSLLMPKRLQTFDVLRPSAR